MIETAYRALVAEDDAIVRQLTMRALAREGFHCDAAQDGVIASERVKETYYDVVIADLLMPEKNGHALAADILAQSNRPAVVILTAVVQPKIAADLVARGVDAIVYKPCNINEFAARVKSVAVRHRRSRTSREAVQLDDNQHQVIVDDKTETAVPDDYWKPPNNEESDEPCDSATPAATTPVDDNVTAADDSHDSNDEVSGEPVATGAGEVPGSPINAGDETTKSPATSNDPKPQDSEIELNVRPDGLTAAGRVVKSADPADRSGRTKWQNRLEDVYAVIEGTAKKVNATVLSFVILLCIGASVLFQVYVTRQQARAIRMLEEMGARMSRNQNGTLDVDMSGCDVAKMMSELQFLNNVSDLDLATSNVSNADLVDLKGLQTLESLNLEHTAVDDKGMNHLFELQQLRDLRLNGTTVSPQKVEELKKEIPGLTVDLGE